MKTARIFSATGKKGVVRIFKRLFQTTYVRKIDSETYIVERRKYKIISTTNHRGIYEIKFIQL